MFLYIYEFPIGNWNSQWALHNMFWNIYEFPAVTPRVVSCHNYSFQLGPSKKTSKARASALAIEAVTPQSISGFGGASWHRFFWDCSGAQQKCKAFMTTCARIARMSLHVNMSSRLRRTSVLSKNITCTFIWLASHIRVIGNNFGMGERERGRKREREKGNAGNTERAKAGHPIQRLSHLQCFSVSRCTVAGGRPAGSPLPV